jgi:hypothetical protein
MFIFLHSGLLSDKAVRLAVLFSRAVLSHHSLSYLHKCDYLLSVRFTSALLFLKLSFK